ncbi:MAG: competence/damage-inducible protein A [Ignavibacteria bacterium]|nr:competence/damage-inducible protein A [Ignavibacteria bacterium]
MMKATIITIGDELLIGQVINTNQAYIAEQLNNAGIIIGRMITVGDIEYEILSAIESAEENSDVVVITGGLGPTHDDITKKTLCKFFNATLVVNEEALQNVKDIVENRNVRWNEMMFEQSLVPNNALVLQNNCGTAPGLQFERNGKYFFAMPGVPREMKEMIRRFVFPFLQQKNPTQIVIHKTLQTIGIAEAHLAERIGNVIELFNEHPKTTLAFLPSIFVVKLRISVVDTTSEKAKEQIQRVENNIREKIGDSIFGIENERLEDVVKTILLQQRKTIAIAESCTGGRICEKLTNVPGSSECFERGIVAYSNTSKIQLLGVDKQLIETFGAVSKEVAEAMAKGVRETSNTSIGISTTGIAGPTGGSTEKPVGLVWIGYSDSEETFATQYFLGKGRNEVKERASLAALELLRKKLLNISLKK